MLTPKVEKAKRLGQREHILELLREAGSKGLTSAELYAVAFRFGARIFELRKAGFNIRTEPIADSQLARFILLPAEKPIQEALPGIFVSPGYADAR